MKLISNQFRKQTIKFSFNHSAITKESVQQSESLNHFWKALKGKYKSGMSEEKQLECYHDVDFVAILCV